MTFTTTIMIIFIFAVALIFFNVLFTILYIKYLKEQLSIEEESHILSKYEVNSLINQLAQQRASHEAETKKKVDEALNKSRAVLRGKATEQLTPLIWEEFHPGDARWIGNPIDYLVIDGLSDYADNISSNALTIYLIDVKTGNSSLSKVQRKIKAAIEEGRMVFAVYNPDTKTLNTFPTKLTNYEEYAPTEGKG